MSAESSGAALLDVPHDIQLGRGRRVETTILVAMHTEDVRDLELRSWHDAQPRTVASGVPSTSNGLLRRWMCWVLTLV